MKARVGWWRQIADRAHRCVRAAGADPGPLDRGIRRGAGGFDALCPVHAIQPKLPAEIIELALGLSGRTGAHAAQVRRILRTQLGWRGTHLQRYCRRSGLCPEHGCGGVRQVRSQPANELWTGTLYGELAIMAYADTRLCRPVVEPVWQKVPCGVGGIS